MSVSARNQLPGTVAIVRTGSVNDEIEISLDNGGTLVAVVTGSSRKALSLEQSRAVVALIKAPWIVLASEDCGMAFSARNQFAGRVMTVEKGALNANIGIHTDAGTDLTAVITNESLAGMDLSEGKRVIALIKASSVILAVKNTD
jgi:molybdenum-pterin binding domain